MRRPILSAASSAVLMVAMLASPAMAQSDPPEAKRDWLITVGGGAQILPRYPGSDDLFVSPMPIFGFRKDGDPLTFGAADQGFGLDFAGGKNFDIGPVVQLQGSRKDKDVGAPVGKVPFTVEGGAYIQTYVAPFLRLRGEARRGLGGHDAWVGDISADFVARNGDRTIFSIGPRVRLSDAKYQRAYFGVTPAAATATGLPVYKPGGGVHALGLASSITHQFNPTWGLRGFAGYDRLVGNADDSPLVRAYGDRNQFSAGLGLSYTFRVRRGGG